MTKSKKHIKKLKGYAKGLEISLSDVMYELNHTSRCIEYVASSCLYDGFLERCKGSTLDASKYPLSEEQSFNMIIDEIILSRGRIKEYINDMDKEIIKVNKYRKNKLNSREKYND